MEWSNLLIIITNGFFRDLNSFEIRHFLTFSLLLFFVIHYVSGLGSITTSYFLSSPITLIKSRSI